MDEALKQEIGDRVPLVISIEDVPSEGQISSIVILARPTNARVDFDNRGSVTIGGFLFTRQQALELAGKITEIVGPLDLITRSEKQD